MTPFISVDIERLIRGDEKVFKSLFDHSYVGMVQRAVYYTNDLNAAEDIVQEVFMRLWEKREELREIQNIQGYLLFSIRNKCLNLLEHQQVMDKYRHSIACYKKSRMTRKNRRLSLKKLGIY